MARSLTLLALVRNPVLHKLVVDRWDADRVVSYYEDGSDVGVAARLLGVLADCDDEDLACEANELLQELTAARARRFDNMEDVG